MVIRSTPGPGDGDPICYPPGAGGDTGSKSNRIGQKLEYAEGEYRRVAMEIWQQREERLTNGRILHLVPRAKCNTILVRVNHSTASVFLSLFGNLSASRFENRAGPLSFGTLARLHPFTEYFLLADTSGTVDVTIFEVFSKDPSILLQNSIAQAVTLAGTIPVNLVGDGRNGWFVQSFGAVNTALTVTRPAESGRQHVLTGYQFLVFDASAGNIINAEVRFGAVVRIRDRIPSGAGAGSGTDRVLPAQLVAPSNTLVDITANAPGAGAVLLLGIFGYTI